MLELRSNSCFPRAEIASEIGLSFVDGAIAVLAFWQLFRIHSRTAHLGWTRQKVLHLMIAFSNIGYFIYFILTLIATCGGWSCWASYCGFLFMACPKILSFAVFLLLLSFWVDLYHQGDDEDDEEESNDYESLQDKSGNESTPYNRPRCFPTVHVGTRQRTVFLVGIWISEIWISESSLYVWIGAKRVTAVIFLLMILFAVLIWIGMGKNPISSSVVARIYVDIFAVAVLLLGGALASYGILIYMKMSNVRSDTASIEMRKVIGLAAVSLVCFTTSSVVALLSDVPVLYCWQHDSDIGIGTTFLVIMYYFIGSSVPSAFVLWIMRELPSQASMMNKHNDTTIVTFVRDEPVVDSQQPQRWTTIASSQNQVAKASPI